MLMRVYLRAFHNYTSRTLVPTCELQWQSSELGFTCLTVSTRNVDAHQLTPQARSDASRAQWGINADMLVVLTAGCLVLEKNLGITLDVFRAVRKRVPRVYLIMIGDGP